MIQISPPNDYDSTKGFLLSSEFREVAVHCHQSAIGKLLPNALYVHVSALESLDPLLQKYEQTARQWLGALPFTLVKFQLDQPKISYVLYPDFDTNAHPALYRSHLVDLATHEAIARNYQNSTNPPVLHRKETFVTSDHPLYQSFTELTRQEDALGLLNQSRKIGTHNGWSMRLAQARVELHGHTTTEAGWIL